MEASSGSNTFKSNLTIVYAELYLAVHVWVLICLHIVTDVVVSTSVTMSIAATRLATFRILKHAFDNDKSIGTTAACMYNGMSQIVAIHSFWPVHTTIRSL